MKNIKIFASILIFLCLFMTNVNFVFSKDIEFNDVKNVNIEENIIPDDVDVANNSINPRRPLEYSLYRGSFLLWSRDCIYYYRNANGIIDSYGGQTWGWIFPNYIEGRGIDRVFANPSRHTYRARKYVTAGIPTPWGPISPFGKLVEDYLQINRYGHGTWWQG